MVKKIAVLIRDRQGEALRMALGLILMDDIIDVYILDRKVEGTDENKTSIETMKDMEMNIYTNYPETEELQYLTSGEIAQRLLEYDMIVPY
ncbi:MAG TPA: hypothetical protein ENH82_08870 [bacterium]|nr:hypothetical protein [bacterium]